MAVDDGYTKALLHLNGTDAGTTITDESGKAWSCYGNAQLDTAQKKFGTASALFDNATTSYIETVFHPDFDLGNSDFTIDFWIRFSTTVTHRGILEIGAIGAGNSNKITLWYYHDTTTLQVIIGDTVSAFTWAPAVSTWYHVAVCRTKSSNNLAAFINGALVANATNAGAPSIANHVVVGTCPSQNLPFYGWLDELRISNTVRWTNTFTPPTAEYAAAVPTLNANISFSPAIPMQLVRGYIGDIAANISFFPQISGTMEYVPPPQISANISFSPSISGTMRYSVMGDASITVPMFTLSATGAGEHFGFAELSLPMIALLAEGFDHPIGEGNIVLPMFDLTALGQLNEIGNASVVIPIFRLSSEGETNIIGNAIPVLPMFRLSAQGIVGEAGNASLLLPMLRVSGESVEGAVGTGEITIPILRLSTTGMLSVEGTANITIPMFTLFSEIATIAADYLNLVMNLRNNALSLYTNYPFNSFCRFNGISLGATSDKIYKLESGITDNGDEIDWKFKTAFLDMEMKTKKKLRLAWISGKISGDLKVTVSYPDGTSFDYDAESEEVTEDGVRVKFGKGLSSRYIALEVSNIGDSTLTLDSIRLQLDQYLSKR